MFKIKVNDGEERELHVETGIYRDAAAAVPALLGLYLPVEVEIWAEYEGKELSRFRYRIRENGYGQLLVEHLVKTRHLHSPGQ